MLKLIYTEIEVKITFRIENFLILIFCWRTSIRNSGCTIMYAAAYGTVPALIHFCLVKVVLVRDYLHIHTTSKFRAHVAPPNPAMLQARPNQRPKMKNKHSYRRRNNSQSTGGWRLRPRTSNSCRAASAHRVGVEGRARHNLRHGGVGSVLPAQPRPIHRRAPREPSAKNQEGRG
jgi:hypothetical protein